MRALADLCQLYDGPIPPAVLAVARYGSPEMVLLMRARGEAAFFRSMILGQVKTIRARRADGTFYPALFTDLRWYRHQFRGWNRIVAQMRRAIAERDNRPSPVSQTIRQPDPPASNGRPFSKGAPMNPTLQHSFAEHEYL